MRVTPCTQGIVAKLVMTLGSVILSCLALFAVTASSCPHRVDLWVRYCRAFAPDFQKATFVSAQQNENFHWGFLKAKRCSESWVLPVNNEAQHLSWQSAEGCKDLPAFRPVCTMCFFQSSLALRINSYLRLQKMLNGFSFSLLILGIIIQLFHR